MEQITAEGLKVAGELAQRYGFSQDAVLHMMGAMLRGRGGMAQFNHPEFAGSGQWMQGGMMMIGDMFNHSLKARVDALCQAIAGVLASQGGLFPVGSFQAQAQSGGGQQQQVATGVGQQMQVGGGGQQQSSVGGMAQMAPMGLGSSPLFVPDPRDTWWPKELGTPNATGAQNNVRYAFFGDSGRLAVEVNGKVSVYDTGDHRIGGFSQQQGPGGAVVFSTPAGTVSLASLAALPGLHQQAQSSAQGGMQQQSSSGGGIQQQSSSGMQPMSFGLAGMQPMTPMTFEAMPQSAWWPAELGSPDATGAQNDLRYASFGSSGRLAVEVDGKVSVHDARALRISGISRQGSGAEVMVATPEGAVSLSSLPLVFPIAPAVSETAPAAPAPAAAPSVAVAAPVAPAAAEAEGPREGPAEGGLTEENDILRALERLGELKQKGILTEAEFTEKKTELLRRL